MFTPPKNIIRLGSSVHRSLIQANTHPAGRPCGHYGGDSHT
jgi:hypothetical protein